MINDLKYLLISSLLLLPLISSCGDPFSYNSEAKDSFETGSPSFGLNYSGTKLLEEKEEDWLLPYYATSHNNDFENATPLNLWGEHYEKGTLKISATLHTLSSDNSLIDEDYYFYRNPVNSLITVTLTPPSNHDYDLNIYTLYPNAKDGELPTLAYHSYEPGNDSLEFEIGACLLYIQVLSKNSSYDDYNPYELMISFEEKPLPGILQKENGIGAIWKTSLLADTFFSTEENNAEGTYSIPNNYFTKNIQSLTKNGTADGLIYPTIATVTIWDDSYLNALHDLIYSFIHSLNSYHKDGYIYRDTRTGKTIASLEEIATKYSLNLSTFSSLSDFFIPHENLSDLIKHHLWTDLSSLISFMPYNPKSFSVSIYGDVRKDNNTTLFWNRYMNLSNPFIEENELPLYPENALFDGEYHTIGEGDTLEAVFKA